MTLAALNTMVYAIGDVGTKEGASYKTLEIRDDRKMTLQKCYFMNNALCGAILIGDTSKMKEMTEGVLKKKAFHEIF